MERTLTIADRIRAFGSFIADVAKSFFKDDCYDKASALAFYSALSIVPALAVVFGIAQGFGFGKNLEEEISTQFFQQQPEITSRLIQFAHSWLQNVEGGVIAGVGTAILLWSAISLLNSVENALNEIWKIEKGRSFLHKIRDYMNVLFIAPIIFVVASSINIYLIAQLTQTTYQYVKALSPVLLFFLNLFPFFLIWILFTFLYVFIPNTKVTLRDAGIAGIIAGTAFQFWQWLYIKFQVNVTTYSAVYGSFAALPLFLIWLQVSWLIVLFGAEIAVAIENRFFGERNKPQELPFKTAVLWVMYQILEPFARGEPPIKDLELAHHVKIPINHMHRILELLAKKHLISEVASEGDIVGYQPARPIDDITIQLVAKAIEESDTVPHYPFESAELHKIKSLLASMEQATDQCFGKKGLFALMEP